MALSSVVVKILCLAVIAMVGAAPSAEAISCGQVSSSLAPCINYLKGSGGAVPTGCCIGIRSLNSAAQTLTDRQTACKCLKSAASSIKNLNVGLAAGLPRKCGVSVPYKISPGPSPTVTACSEFDGVGSREYQLEYYRIYNKRE